MKTTPSLHLRAIATAALALAFSMGASGQYSGSSTTDTTGKAGAAATSGTAAPQGEGKAATMAGADRDFVLKAAMGGMAEVELGQLAQDKATNDQVKQFAQRMVQDHGKANDELKQIASGKGLTLPTALDKKHAEQKQKLGKLSGADFDREYMEHMVSDHRKTVNDFEKQAKSGKDADVKGYAAKTLPTLQEHLKMARSIEDAVKSAKGAAKNPT